MLYASSPIVTSRPVFPLMCHIAGGGKTVLASSVINHLKQNAQSQQTAVAYFYCEYREQDKQEPSKILGALFSMIAAQSKSVLQEIQSFFRMKSKQNPTYQPGFDELRKFSRLCLGLFR